MKIKNIEILNKAMSIIDKELENINNNLTTEPERVNLFMYRILCDNLLNFLEKTQNINKR